MKSMLFTIVAIVIAYSAMAQSFADSQLTQVLPNTNKANPSFVQVKSMSADSEATFPGGVEALRLFLAGNMHYPQVAIENGIEGTVRVRFKVDDHGKAMDPVVVHSVHRLVDSEVLTLIRRMPDWSPRIENGVAVESYVEIPVELALR